MTKGQLFLWPDRALVLGVALDSHPHAHFAAQWSWGISGSFRTRLKASDPWQETRATFFAPNQEHQLDSTGTLLAHLFVVLPTRRTPLCSQLHADFAQGAAQTAFAVVQQHLQALLTASASAQQQMAHAESVLQHWLNCALPSSSDALPIPSGKLQGRDAQRMQHAFQAITTQLQANPGDKPEASKLAANLYLSESRFTHLFKLQAGMSLSRYVLWCRVQLALQAIAGGVNITQAAHQAGFADLAHMSRSFRAMIGVNPSALQKMTIAFKSGGLN